MGRLSWLFVLAAGCAYKAPASGDDQPAPDTPSEPDPDGPLPDTTVTEPDAPPDAPIPDPVTTDFVASADTWIDSVSPNTSFANDSTLLTDGGPPAVTLIRFDLSGLPTTTTVMSAELHVFTTTDEGATVTVFPVLQSWSETSATWNSRSTGVLWSSPGAAPPSRGMTMIATFTPNLENTEFASAVDAATVQGWVTTPDDNFGIAITSVNSDGPKFRTRLSTNGKPFLRVVHVP